MSPRPQDVQATFCATLVDEWTRCGVLDAVIAPGSRSTPLALALARHPGIEVHVHPDERSAGFLALGLSLATAVPTVVLTTSGTAAVELHPAVVEADLAHVPLIVCTADRPPELHDVGAAQTIDQTRLYGGAVRWFHDPGVAEEDSASRWRALARRALSESTGSVPGPVHLNLAFREPLLGHAGMLPPEGSPSETIEGRRAPALVLAGTAVTAIDGLVGQRGVFVAGPGSGPGRPLHELAVALGWPVLAAPQASVWGVAGAAVPSADALLRSSWLLDVLQPEVVVRLGLPVASKVVGEWIARSGAHEIAVVGPGRWVDPHGTADAVLQVDPGALLAAWGAATADIRPVAEGVWRQAWYQAGAAAQAAIADVLRGSSQPTEPGVARAVVAALPNGVDLVISSSMPIRDVEWYAQPRPGVRVHANRGANGIDGVVSTAVGIAAGTGRPTVLLIGDVAFLHDSNGLLGASGREIDLVIVVVDNDGGGIFSFLPQAEALAREEYETLFGTPHGLDLVPLAQAYDVTAVAIQEAVEVGPAVMAALAAGGVHVLVVRTDRDGNVQVHERLHDAVAAAIEATT